MKEQKWIRMTLMPSGRVTRYSPERRETMASRFQADLREARDTKEASTIICECDQHKNLRLCTYQHTGSELLSLRRFPNSGPSHAADCEYHERVNRDGGVGTYAKECIWEDGNGELHIALRYSLRVATDKGDADGPEDVLPPRQRRAGTKQAKMSFLGLLHLLWENTERNVWYPQFNGTRTLSNLMYALHTEARKIKQGHTQLSNVLVLQGQIEINRAAFSHAVQHNRRLVVISELRAWTNDREVGTGLLETTISTGNTPTYLNFDNNLWQHTLNRFPQARAWWRAGGKVMAIAVTDVPHQNEKYQRASVRQVCLMMVSDRWIPLESSYEGAVEKKLFTEGRSFSKPLIYDSAENEYHPDFILTDTQEDSYPMEVWGRENEEYQAHKIIKTEWYQTEYGDNWWQWDAVSDPDEQRIPDFPARA